MAVTVNKDEQWDRVITSKPKLLDLRLKEVVEYRDLVWFLIKRDFTLKYKQTILGPLWHIISPIISTVMYTFVFGKLAGLGTDGIPFVLFYFSGTMLWTYFSSVLSSVSDIFAQNAGIFGKIYFPRLASVISVIGGLLIKLIIQFAVMLCFYFYYLLGTHTVTFCPLAFATPLLIIWLTFLGTGIGLVISAITTKYRDIKMMLGYVISLAMYATPIVYPLSQASEKFKWIFYVNPVSAPVELFRVWFYGKGFVPLDMTILSLVITIVSMFFGLILFEKNSRTFIDVI